MDDIHFMKEAKLWSEQSTCLSRHIGAVLVKDGHTIAGGFNGPPITIGCEWRDDDGAYHIIDDGYEPITEPNYTCPRKRMGYGSGEGMEHCPAVHGEILPILRAAKCGVAVEGATLYAYCGIPCSDCAKEIIKSGVSRVVCLSKEIRPKTAYNFSLSEQLFKLAGITVDYIPRNEVE